MDLVEIAKAYGVAKSDEYRTSVVAGINPRSETEVRRGSAHRRGARVILPAIGGGVAASQAGAVIGAFASKGKYSGAKKGAQAGALLGTAAGASLGRQANLNSGDTRATHRKTGKKATSAASLNSGMGVWRYKDQPKSKED